MRIDTSYCAVLALMAQWALAGCTSSSSKPTVAVDASVAQTPFGEFDVSLVPANNGAFGTGANLAYTTVTGQVFDGPTPNTAVVTPLPIPSDATVGCVVYAVTIPTCTDVGGCTSGSTYPACAAAAISGNNTCVCVATDTCQANPTAKDVGTVTVNGIADSSDAAAAFQLVNTGNTYQVSPNTELAYPGFSEGDPITIAATGGDYPPFEITAEGIAPLILTPGPPYNFHIAKVPSSSDAGAEANQYEAFTVTWVPPGAANASRFQMELDLGHHGGSAGYLACDVDDNGSLTVSASLINQLIGLGHIGGFPELTFARVTSTSATVAQGKVNLVIDSTISAPTLTMDGYISCGDYGEQCPTGLTCNAGVKLCQ